MTEPVRIEDEIAQLDFQPRCELQLLPPSNRCTNDAAALVDIHGHCHAVGRDVPWRRMFMCAPCLTEAKRVFERETHRSRCGLECATCQMVFTKFTEMIPMVKPL